MVMITSYVVALINLSSGGKGTALYAEQNLIKELGADRVHHLGSGDGESFDSTAHTFLLKHQPTLVIVAGGDGTISYVMDMVKKLHEQGGLPWERGVIAPLPIGTGNDMSHTLGFGLGFSSCGMFRTFRFRQAIRRYQSAKLTPMDRWSLACNRGPSLLGKSNSRALQRHVMNNYFSIGFDATIAKDLDGFRKHHPRLFFARPVVKLWYAFFAFLALFTEQEINSVVRIQVDGKDVPMPPKTKAIVVSNVLSYAGGCTLWSPRLDQKSAFQRPSINDGMLEVTALDGVWHLGMVRLGVCYGRRLGQGRRIIINSPATLRFQYDGEPIRGLHEEGEGNVEFELSFASTANVLRGGKTVSSYALIGSMCVMSVLVLFIVAAVHLPAYMFY